MLYRTMQINDYEEIISLWNKSNGVQLRNTDSKEGIEKYLKRNPQLSFIAQYEGKIIGTIMSGHDGKRGYIQHLAVEEAFRKKGIASKLIELTLEALKKEGILKSHIHVLNTNIQGQKFWLKKGWFFRSDLVVYSFVNDEDKNI